MERKIYYLGSQGSSLQYQKNWVCTHGSSMPYLFLAIQPTQDRNQIQLEIKINTLFLFESVPSPKPILYPGLSQYEDQSWNFHVKKTILGLNLQGLD